MSARPPAAARLRTAAAGLVLALPLVLTGCAAPLVGTAGGTPGGAFAVDPAPWRPLTADTFVGRTQAAAARATSVRVTTHVRASGKAADVSEEARAERMSWRSVDDWVLPAVEGAARDRTAPTYAGTTVIASGARESVVDVRAPGDGTAFVRVDGGRATGGAWVRVGPRDGDGDDPWTERYGSVVGATDPRTAFALPAGTISGVTTLGAGRIDGVAVQEYAVSTSIPTGAFADTADAEGKGPKDRPELAVLRVWVGQDDLVRRTVLATGRVEQTVEYTRWDAPVTVEAPPAAQTVAGSDAGPVPASEG